MAHYFTHWLGQYWGWLLSFIGTVVAVMIAYKQWHARDYIEFLGECSVRRIENNKIRVNEHISVTSNTPTVMCTGYLIIGKMRVILPQTPCLKDQDSYWVVLDGEYKGSYSGQALLRLKVILGNRKTKSITSKISVNIPEKQNIKTDPPDIITPWGRFQGEEFR